MVVDGATFDVENDDDDVEEFLEDTLESCVSSSVPDSQELK